jgi:hypothetical protein
MTPARRPVLTAAFALVATLSAHAQMHKVAAPEQVTRAVGVYEYVGDLSKPKAARLIPISLFIGGHFEDAAIYMARPVPFAIQSGFRYELMDAGVRKQFLDVLTARNFAGSSAAPSTPFDDGWFGYGRVIPLPSPKASRLRPNCGNAHVVEEVSPAKKDDGKPHFGNKSDTTGPTKPAIAKDDPCRPGLDDDRPEKISLDDAPKDKNAPDPERPTLHRSPETTANNSGSSGKPDKKANKPVAATVTANSGPGDDPDRPIIRHRETDEDDPNNLPPDPIDFASRTAAAKAAGKQDEPAATAVASAPRNNAAPGSNDTIADGGAIYSGDTMSGGPVLRRGKLTQPKDDPATAPAAARPTATAAKPVATTTAKTAAGKSTAKPTLAAASTTPGPIPPSVIPPPLDAIVAVSDAKDRAPHDYTYKFASGTERAAALQSLEAMAQAVLANPALATDALETTHAPAPPAAPAKPAPAKATATHSATAAHPTTAAARARAKAAADAAAVAKNALPILADEQMAAFQLYYSAPISYTFTARTPATATTPERYVTVIATTDAEGKIIPGFRSVTDAAHLDRIPRYRLIDAVDADGSNRAELLMELRAQHTRQFALYRLLGNKPDQVFLSGSTLL